MNREKQKTLVKKLTQFDENATPFLEARKQLLTMGYTNQEIANALYSFSYDGIPKKAKDDELARLFANSPAEADRIGKYLLQNLGSDKQKERASNYAASVYAPGLHAKVKYEYKLASEYNFPYITFLFASLASFIFTITQDMHKYFIYIGPGLVVLYWLCKQFVHFNRK